MTTANPAAAIPAGQLVQLGMSHPIEFWTMQAKHRLSQQPLKI